jgi:hypothetical protein
VPHHRPPGEVVHTEQQLVTGQTGEELVTALLHMQGLLGQSWNKEMLGIAWELALEWQLIRKQ